MISVSTISKYLRTVLASRTAKRTYLILGLAVLSFAPHVLAADGFVPLAPIPGLTDETTVGSVIDSAALATFFNNLYKYLIGVAATIAVIEIIWGGILYSTTDSVGNKEEGKEKIRMAIFGLILVLSPVLVFSIINPSILNLSINLKPIKTLSVPAQTAQDTAVPEGGTAYANGSTTPVGQWCFSSMPRQQGYGRGAVPLCWPSEDNCLSVLAAAKANPTDYPYSVNERATCVLQQ